MSLFSIRESLQSVAVVISTLLVFAVHEHRDVLNSRYRTWCIFNYDGSCVSIELFAKDVTLICLKRF